MKHMKFKSVRFNNRKKVFNLTYTSGLEVECPYSALAIDKKVIEAGPDPEVGYHSFYLKLENGEIDYVPFDQPLHIVKNPDYLRSEAISKMTHEVKDMYEEKNISKREIARRMNTSVTQINRLLDINNFDKNLSRLIQMAAVLGYEFELSLKKVT